MTADDNVSDAIALLSGFAATCPILAASIAADSPTRLFVARALRERAISLKESDPAKHEEQIIDLALAASQVLAGETYETLIKIEHLAQEMGLPPKAPKRLLN